MFIHHNLNERNWCQWSIGRGWLAITTVSVDTVKSVRIIQVMIPAKLERKNRILRFGTQAIPLLFSVLAFWGASLVREGNIEGVFPWQMDKLRCLLTTSGIWLALVGVVVLASTLLRDHSGDSKDRKSVV